MKKKFEDIVPADKRSIRNIPLPHRENRGNFPMTDGIRPAQGHRPATHGNRVHEHKRPELEPEVIEESFSEPIEMEPKKPAQKGIKIHKKKAAEESPEELYAALKAKEAAARNEPKSAAKNTLRSAGAAAGVRPSDGIKHKREEYFEAGGEDFGESAAAGGGKKTRWRAWTFIIAIILVAAYFLSAYFARADVSISLAKRDIPVSNVKVPLREIDYTVASTDLTKSAAVQANGNQKVSRKATGTVIIYNVANTNPQRLLINTRLETLDGHIFKTDKEVTVPAVKVVNGKKIAGSVEVTVTADQPGEGYNLGLKDFNLAGFKGTDNYESFYGRSKTPLTGGFVGTVPNISQADLANSVTNLKKGLATEANEFLVKKIGEESSAEHDYVYIKGGEVIEYSQSDVKQASDGKSATVTVAAKVSGLGISNAAISGILAKSNEMPQTEPQTASTTEPEKFSGDLSKLTLTVPSGTTARALVASQNDLNSPLTVTLNGTASVISNVNEDAMARAISRLSRDQAIEAVKGMVDVNMIEVSVKPWWLRSLPSADKIRIHIEQ